MERNVYKDDLKKFFRAEFLNLQFELNSCPDLSIKDVTKPTIFFSMVPKMISPFSIIIPSSKRS
jgi:hypothetical protein